MAWTTTRIIANSWRMWKRSNGGVGALGVIPTFLNAKIKELAASGDIANVHTPMDAERAMAVRLTHD